MNKSFIIILCFVIAFGVIEIVNGFLIGLYGMPYLNWGLLLLLSSFPLGLVIFILLICVWGKWQWKIILPIGLLIIFFVASLVFIKIGISFTQKPNNPKNFFTEQTQNELTLNAEKLSETKYIYIQILPDKSLRAMVMNGDKVSEVSEVPNEFLVLLRKYSLDRVEVDRKLGMVTFGYYFSRTWIEYIYSKDSLKEPNHFSKKLADHWYYYTW